MISLLTALIPTGFSLLKMLKKSGKVGATATVALAAAPELLAQSGVAVPPISFGDAFWLGLASAVLTAIVNYLNQVRTSKKK